MRPEIGSTCGADRAELLGARLVRSSRCGGRRGRARSRVLLLRCCYDPRRWRTGFDASARGGLPVLGDAHPQTYFLAAGGTLKNAAVVYWIVRFSLNQRHRRANNARRSGIIPIVHTMRPEDEGRNRPHPSLLFRLQAIPAMPRKRVRSVSPHQTLVH